MDKTITIEYEDTHTVLTRATLADARVRKQLFAALDDVIKSDSGNSGAGTFCYYFTQLVSTDASDDQKLTVCPEPEKVREMFDDWCSRTDEVLAAMIANAISTLIAIPDQKKEQSVTLPKPMLEVVKTPIPEMTTSQSR